MRFSGDKIGRVRDKGVVSEESFYRKFLTYIQELHLLYFIKTLDQYCLVIASRGFVKAIGEVKCQITTPEAIDHSVFEEVQYVLVFCEKGEVRLVKQLKEQYPDKAIVSGTYEYIVMDKVKKSLFRFPYKRPTAECEGPDQPVLFLSAPYSDAEFFGECLEKSNIIKPVEYLGRAHAAWMSRVSSFQPVRFFDEVQRRYGWGDGFSIHLQTDVLSALFEYTSLTNSRFIRFLKDRHFKVIVFLQHDPIMQASMGQLLQDSKSRSVLELSRGKKIELPDMEFYKTVEHMMRSEQDYAWLKSLADKIPNSFVVTSDDLAKDRVGAVQSVAHYLGVDFDEESLSKLNDRGTLAKQAQYSGHRDWYGREMIDRLGLNGDF